MIGVVITIGVCVLIMYKVYITNKENNKRIKELERRLDSYYKWREERLKSKGLIK